MSKEEENRVSHNERRKKGSHSISQFATWELEQSFGNSADLQHANLQKHGKVSEKRDQTHVKVFEGGKPLTTLMCTGSVPTIDRSEVELEWFKPVLPR